MIARLIDSLRALAADQGSEQDPVGDAVLDELAADYADAFLLVSDCPQIRLTSEQAETLRALDALLEQGRYAGAGQSNTRRQVRTAARRALAALGEPNLSL